MGVLGKLRAKFYRNAEEGGAALSGELEAGGQPEEPPTGAELVAQATYETPTKGPLSPRQARATRHSRPGPA